MMPRIMIAGTKSGCGKTMMTCAILQELKNRGYHLMACKSGPDYIDPMFHSRIIGTESCNLDLFFASKEQICQLLQHHAQGMELTILEAAMGFYDGIAMTSQASAWELAQVTQTPVLLVLDARGTGVSICAEINGFLSYREKSGIRGVLLNQCSPMLYSRLKAVIEEQCGLSVLGYLPKLPDCAIESRHLGLLTAGEIGDLKEKMDKLAETARKTLDFFAIEELARSAPEWTLSPQPAAMTAEHHPVIAVAKDEAFCFYYRDNLELLQQFGGNIVEFSPLREDKLPPCDALYLGGGYPELYAEQLSQNQTMRRSIRQQIQNGLPTIAECGGFLYLQSSLEDQHGTLHEMCGVFSGSGYQTPRLQRFGYITMTARKENLLCGKGESFPAHEFHYWDCTNPGDSFQAQKPHSSRGWRCAIATETLYAGFPHLYFPAKPELVQRFLRAAIDHQRRKQS